MGVLITCNDEFIAKYAEIHRIVDEVGVGRHYPVAPQPNGPIDNSWREVNPPDEEFEAIIFELSKEDLPQLVKFLEEEENDDIDFFDVIESIKNYMEKVEQDIYYFVTTF